ncbi:hypothetical protein [Muricoccus pecuniae]|uniref:Uncharacterized protein n=1 Tax=Muricoccus pecuniae TaxID=693023 RepID=A0A840Y0A8_9PROT|nr:hypothetical protein [Roseomonas pecuniae]MBB5693576.1 hypothetical protein [Roseomonas pecuniae]
MALLETAPEVKSFAVHPELIMLADGPEWLAFVPSLAVTAEGFRATVELSPLGFPRSDRQKRVADLARTHCNYSEAPLVEIPFAAVRSKPRASDAVLLLGNLHLALDDAAKLKVSDLLRGGPARLDNLERSSGVGRESLLGLVAQGELERLGCGPITSATEVAVTRRGGEA